MDEQLEDAVVGQFIGDCSLIAEANIQRNDTHEKKWVTVKSRSQRKKTVAAITHFDNVDPIESSDAVLSECKGFTFRSGFRFWDYHRKTGA